MSLQSDTSGDYISTTTLQFHEEEVVKDAIEKTGFQPVKLLNKSHWWGSKDSGAFHYAGEFEGKKAILKIQGAKSSLSEAEMIASFAKVNKSQTIRPPHLYAQLPWSESLEYEALILEWIKDDKVIECPAFVTEVVLFYSLYEDYRLHCVTEPWVVKPQGDAASYIQEKFALWRQEGKKMYPEHPLRRDEDEKLIEQAVEILTREYAGVPLEFQHGHFSAKDLFWVNDQVVLLSNLYWSWRAPFYDGVFGYH